MNTILKRKLSSVIASESIAKNIGNGKYVNFCNTSTARHNIIGDRMNRNKGKGKGKDKDKNKYNIASDSSTIKEEPEAKRQKKTPDRKTPDRKTPDRKTPDRKTPDRKTHYNDKMEPIRLSSSGLSGGNGAVAETGYFPKRIREVVWNTYNGETYSSKCFVPWCSNIINVFNYQVGHDIPESKGGTYDIGNLRPICSNCNLSMGNKWTIQEWGKLVNPGQEQIIEMQKENTKDIKTESPTITPATTSRITFFTLLLLALNFMII
jgi:HNH endonuclease